MKKVPPTLDDEGLHIDQAQLDIIAKYGDKYDFGRGTITFIPADKSQPTVSGRSLGFFTSTHKDASK